MNRLAINDWSSIILAATCIASWDNIWQHLFLFPFSIGYIKYFQTGCANNSFPDKKVICANNNSFPVEEAICANNMWFCRGFFPRERDSAIVDRLLMKIQKTLLEENKLKEMMN